MKSILLILMSTIFCTNLSSQNFYIFRVSASDYDFRSSAKRFLTEGGNPLSIVADDLSHTNGVGVDLYYNIAGQLYLNSSLYYKSSTVLGNSTFRYKYTISENAIDSSIKSNADIKYAQFKLGLGYRLTKPSSAIFF